MQLDPAGLVDGLNRYAYVKNSPVMGVDPTGLEGVIFFHSSDGGTLAAKELIKMDTIFTIAGHGDPQGINDQRLSADNKIWLDDPEIIAKIARDSGHIEGQKILLLACQTGSADFAKRLAIAAKSPVIAPVGYGVLPSTDLSGSNEGKNPYKSGDNVFFSSKKERSGIGDDASILEFQSDG